MNNLQLYLVTDYGKEYIASDDVYRIAQKEHIIGTAEFMLAIFAVLNYEIDGRNYPSYSLPTLTKIQVLIDDGFIVEYK